MKNDKYVYMDTGIDLTEYSDIKVICKDIDGEIKEIKGEIYANNNSFVKNHKTNELPIGFFEDGTVTFFKPVKIDTIYQIFGNIGFMSIDMSTETDEEMYNKIKIYEWSSLK